MRRSIRNLLCRWPVLILLWAIVVGDAAFWIDTDSVYQPLVTRVLPFYRARRFIPHAHNSPRAIIVMNGSTVKLVDREDYYEAMKNDEKAFEAVGEIGRGVRQSRRAAMGVLPAA